ncbi:MAG TPA: AmmeMemoRadiSam system protein B [Terriglobales bacterium]|nr:AmmeMemoRadiSam system protein B [Terriglobales bacterium]
MKRRPYVAGSFYPGGRAALLETLGSMTDRAAVKKKALAVVVPHAGYVYSGPVAGAVFSSVEVPRTAVILGPAHKEIGSLLAVQREGSWQTPLGESPVESGLADLILEKSPLASNDARSHLGEHSLEVELPFLQYFEPDVAIVPVCVSHEAAYDELEAFGRALADAVRAFGRDVLIVASTDMSHYVSQKTAEAQDALAIRKVLELDAPGLFKTVRDKRITMCGFQPTTAAIVAAVRLGASRAELVSYQTSGERTGDYSQVVGYAGIRILPGNDS